MKQTKTRITKITIGRLYNLGNYEHVRYDLTAEVAPGESARKALIGLEKIVMALAPEKQACVHTRGELEREINRVAEMRKRLKELGADEFRRREGHLEGTPLEYIRRCQQTVAENQKRRGDYERRCAKAREYLDAIGGAEKWKDAKLDWQDFNDD